MSNNESNPNTIEEPPVTPLSEEIQNLINEPRSIPSMEELIGTALPTPRSSPTLMTPLQNQQTLPRSDTTKVPNPSAHESSTAAIRIDTGKLNVDPSQDEQRKRKGAFGPVPGEVQQKRTKERSEGSNQTKAIGGTYFGMNSSDLSSQIARTGRYTVEAPIFSSSVPTLTSMEYFIPQNQQTLPPSDTVDTVNPSAQKTTESIQNEAPGTSMEFFFPQNQQTLPPSDTTDKVNTSAQKTTSESNQTEAPGLTDCPAETPVPILSTFIKVPVEALGNFDKGRADCWVELLKHASIIRHPQPH